MTLRAARLSGAILILAVGAVHLQQYTGGGYSSIPTIGTLFLLNAIGSAVVGLGLLLPLGNWLEERRSDLAVGLLSMGGLAIAVGSLVALFISENTTLFGFSEAGYRAVIVLAIVVEAAAAVLLAPVAVLSLKRALAAGRRRSAGYAASRSA
jgi:hypothetical protein